MTENSRNDNDSGKGDGAGTSPQDSTAWIDLTTTPAPTVVYHKDEDGNPSELIKTISYYNKEGALHREHDLPAVIEWYDDGIIRGFSYHINGVMSRASGRHSEPALSMFHENGVLSMQSWYKNGVLHRDVDEGPAVLVYSRSGDVTQSAFYMNGELNTQTWASSN